MIEIAFLARKNITTAACLTLLFFGLVPFMNGNNVGNILGTLLFFSIIALLCFYAHMCHEFQNYGSDLLRSRNMIKFSEELTKLTQHSMAYICRKDGVRDEFLNSLPIGEEISENDFECCLNGLIELSARFHGVEEREFLKQLSISIFEKISISFFIYGRKDFDVQTIQRRMFAFVNSNLGQIDPKTFVWLDGIVIPSHQIFLQILQRMEEMAENEQCDWMTPEFSDQFFKKGVEICQILCKRHLFKGEKNHVVTFLQWAINSWYDVDEDYLRNSENLFPHINQEKLAAKQYYGALLVAFAYMGIELSDCDLPKGLSSEHKIAFSFLSNVLEE